MLFDFDSVKPGCRFVDFSTSVSYNINFNTLTPLDTDLLNSVDLNLAFLTISNHQTATFEGIA